MRNILLTSVAVLAVATSAEAAERHVGWYGSVSGGVNRQHLTELENAGVDRVEFRDGAVVHGALGYAFDVGLRLEFEGGYSENSPKRYRIHHASAGGWRNIGGDSSIYRVMANAAWDFGHREGWILQPYIEAGVGGMLAEIELGHPGHGWTKDANRKKVFRHNKSGSTGFVPAWQVGVGVSAPFTDTSAIFTSIRYSRPFVTPEIGEGEHGSAYGLDYEFASTSVLVGLRWGF